MGIMEDCLMTLESLPMSLNGLTMQAIRLTWFGSTIPALISAQWLPWAGGRDRVW